MAKRRLLIATRNKGKFLAVKKLLRNLPFRILSLDDVKSIPSDFEVQETGKTFRENAVLKAKTFAQLSGLLTLADDSGLEVKALSGRPGIYSARYTLGTDKDRYEKLLKEMENIPDKKRGARYYCVIAIFDPKTKKLGIYDGECQGMIGRQAKGSHGFGYDPVFFLPQLKKTVAQLTLEEKSKISHRGKALRKAKKFLKELLKENKKSN